MSWPKSIPVAEACPPSEIRCPKKKRTTCLPTCTQSEKAMRGVVPDLLDRSAGALLFAISLLLVIPAAIATYILSRRSPFIAHLRIGKYGRAFWVWKLRTMWPREQPTSASEQGWVERIECEPPLETKPRADQRVTSRFAQFCRRHSIDELPQFLHVMRGEMSLVGPRPLTRGELKKHYGAVAWGERVVTLAGQSLTQ